MALRNGLISGERHISQAELQEDIARAAAGFAALGVRAKDCVAILMRNDFPFLATMFAANRLGAYAVPINWHFKPGEIRYILEDSGSKVLVAHADLLADCRSDLPPGVTVIEVPTPPEILSAYAIPRAKGVALEGPRGWGGFLHAHAPSTAAPLASPGSIVYTSGTTGRPKGVRRLPPTPAQAEVQIEMGRVVYNARPGVRSIVPGPLYHSAPLGAASRTVPQADLTVLMPRFDPIALLEAIQEHRIEQMFAVPTMFVRLLKLPEAVRRKYDVSSLKFVMHAAAPCPADIKRQMIAWWGPIIWEFYGSTESLAVTICNSEEWLAHPGTVGRPYPGADVRIVGDDGRELPVGEIGEIFAGIPGAPDFTYQGRDEERVKVGLGGGRLITSGDVGYLDKDGFLYLCDRKRDMVISGGVNIYPAEIEAVLVAMPEVEDGCVFGIPDAEYGERLHAVVQPAAGAKLDAAAVRAYLAKHLANYKVPHSIEFRGDLPRQDSGKIYKRLLREPHWAGRTTRI